MLRGIIVRLFKGHSVGTQLSQSKGFSSMPQWPSQHNYGLVSIAVESRDNDIESTANLTAISKGREGRIPRLNTV